MILTASERDKFASYCADCAVEQSALLDHLIMTTSLTEKDISTIQAKAFAFGLVARLLVTRESGKVH